MSTNIALVFPGQGSQSVGMLAKLAAEHAQIQETFTQASEVLGYDLWDLAQNGPEDKLNQTEHTQPVLLAAGVAVWRVWQELDNKPLPQIMAGHSLGEYTALVCANSLAFDDGLKVVAIRGRLMQRAVSVDQGAMAAIIGLTDDKVQMLCEELAQGQVLSPANYNSPGQVVVAGDKAAVERIIPAAKKAGAKLAKLIAVSVPSHCQLMLPAAKELAEYLADITFVAPSIPVVHNVDISCYENPNEIKNALVKQLYNPVRWVETIQYFAKENIKKIYECGPGRVLTGLNKRIEKHIPTLPLEEKIE